MAIFKKILVAYDGSSHSEKAVAKAVEFMEADPSVETHVVNVTHSPHLDMYSLYGLSISQDLADEIDEANKEAIVDAKKLLKGHLNKCRFVRLQGDASQEIMEYTEKEKVDLVILGSRGLGAFKGMLLGSVSHRIVQQADCHVLVIK